MSKPIQHTISATSASHFEDWINAVDPTALTDPIFLAEGDSWFNKFYPSRDNLLEPAIALGKKYWISERGGVNRVNPIFKVACGSSTDGVLDWF